LLASSSNTPEISNKNQKLAQPHHFFCVISKNEVVVLDPFIKESTDREVGVDTTTAAAVLAVELCVKSRSDANRQGIVVLNT
jgi:hypothetical protein